MGKDTFYFSHDYNARTDKKIKKLIRAHRMEGYGIFWALVEDLYNNDNELEADYEAIAEELKSTIPVVKSVVEDFELFVISSGSFGSNSIAARLGARVDKSEKARASINTRWAKVKEAKEGSGSEVKKSFVEPDLSEVVKYFVDNGFSAELGDKAWRYYNEAKWHDGLGNAVKNWKQKMQAVWFKKDNNLKEEVKNKGDVTIIPSNKIKLTNVIKK